MMRKGPLRLISLAAFLLLVVAGGCGGSTAPASGCAKDANVICPGSYVGWSCKGFNTPDEIANVNKVIDSIVCAGTGEVLTNGAAAYCCTPNTTTCAADPRVVCPNQCNDPTGTCANALVGYSCMGTNRPDAFLTGDGGGLSFSCQQGIKAYGLIQYCCGGMTPGGCLRNTNVACSKGTLGFSCAGQGIPSETDLGMNQSRSEVPLICSLSTPSSTPPYVKDYCCYTPTAAPPGATCLQDQLQGQSGVPGCQPGSSFGFACTGKDDRPDQDYPRIACGHGSVQGSNALGIPASLYCCDFHQ